MQKIPLWVLVLAAGVSLAAGCGDAPEDVRDAAAPRASRELAPLPDASPAATATRAPDAAVTPEEPAASTAERSNRVALVATPAPTPLPESQDAQQAPVDATSDRAEAGADGTLRAEAEWLGDRISTVVSLYNLTDEGRDTLMRLDLRQMRGQPGWFGSYGYKGWTGVGEAKPAPIIHELSHAYWGAFPVSGFPRLSWDPEGGLSPALERYHQDVLLFMKQPPDHYELLRSRLRNIPELSEDNLGGLFHSIEGDMVNHVTGDLDLLPPILRKYWDRFLQPGPWHSWYEAAAWFQSLAGDERSLFDQYSGFPHLDLRAYGSATSSRSTPMSTEVVDALGREERQRLWDFADQFELLLGAPEHDENFDFWRGYLRDMLRLHERHQGFLASLELENARPIGEAFSFLQDLRGDDDERARAIAAVSVAQPLVLHFLPVLDNHVLLSYFNLESEPPELATIRGTAAFVKRLRKFTPIVDDVLAQGRISTGQGAEALTRFLELQDLKNSRDLSLFIELLRDADGSATRRIFAALDGWMIRRLVQSVAAPLRSVTEPQRLLEAIGISEDSTLNELRDGIDLLAAYPSGNFLIDEPFLARLYEVVAAVAEGDESGVLGVIADSRFPMEGFIRAYPDRAVAVLSSDLVEAARIVMRSDSVTFPPARFIYRLMTENPEFAALLVGELSDMGNAELVMESLAHFAYDADRLEAVPGLPISLAADGRFLSELLDSQGPEWLARQIRVVLRVNTIRMAQGDMPGDYIQAYRRTLDASVGTLEEGKSKRTLQQIVDSSFSAATAG